jgi:hypothetical protein
MTNNPNYTSVDAVRCIRTEIDLRKRNAEMGSPAPAVALAATSNKRDPTIVCSNCKKLYHTIDFCIKKGGKMAGRTIEDAQAAQRLATGKPTRPSPTTTAGVGTTKPLSALVATNAPSIGNTNANPPPLGSVVIHGVPYALTPLSTAAPATANIATQIISPTGTAGTSGNMTDLVQYTAFISDHNPSRASLDWKEFARDIDERSLEAWSAESGTIFSTYACPFLMDTGATCHILPNREDFLKLSPISPHPVHGLGDSCVYAVGMGVLSLPLDTGESILLQNALFVPASKVRLLSVLSLNRAGDFVSHFDSQGCWVTTQDGLCLARGTVIPGRDLYTMFSNPSGIDALSTTPTPPTCLYSSRLPNVETWHRRLGHCGNRAIIDMARNGTVTGMPIDLSTTPPKCNECILRKQARLSVPRVREGEKATAWLGRVYIDLTGPMSIKTKAGNWYLMNIIDDFSSYVWSIPLASKSDATQALQTWHRTIVNQSDARLKIINTNNGELLSNATTDWCATHGIVHHLTAPHTSAHNGRVERLHRTIMGKARAMRLACNAPSELWDEFCATAAYLTNFTASSSNDGKTPHELWFSSKPSLTHLREIGCKAFALILSSNPKIFQRSVPCILIGYAPHSKAYRLWNPASGRVFNSFHVTFVEHLDELPTLLLPGTIVPLNAEHSDPTWDTVGIPPLPTLHIPAHTSAPAPSPTSYNPLTTAIPNPPLPLPAPLPTLPPALPPPPPPPLPLPPPTATVPNQNSVSGPPIGSAHQPSASGPIIGSAPQHPNASGPATGHPL